MKPARVYRKAVSGGRENLGTPAPRNLEVHYPSMRKHVVSEVERCGVVAIIRMKDPGKLAGVVDALLAGGVRVLEGAMTVPGAGELVRGLAKTLPAGMGVGGGTGV